MLNMVNLPFAKLYSFYALYHITFFPKENIGQNFFFITKKIVYFFFNCYWRVNHLKRLGLFVRLNKVVNVIPALFS